MDAPITTECDALREEVALLAAENRRLMNEINELRRVPAYPEAAVRAVWRNGVAVGAAAAGLPVLWLPHSDHVARVFVEALRDA